MALFTLPARSSDTRLAACRMARRRELRTTERRIETNGALYLFELGEVTDEKLAEQLGISQRTQTDGEGGFLSEEEPLVRMILKKAQSKYHTGGMLLDLVLHYDKQYPFAPVEYLSRHEA